MFIKTVSSKESKNKKEREREKIKCITMNVVALPNRKWSNTDNLNFKLDIFFPLTFISFLSFDPNIFSFYILTTLQYSTLDDNYSVLITQNLEHISNEFHRYVHQSRAHVIDIATILNTVESKANRIAGK